jgi:hypothetical protein
MKTIKCLGIGIFSLLFNACMVMDNFAERGSGRMATDQRNVSGVTGVSLATVGELFIEAGNTESLRIEAEDNLIPLIQTDVRDGVLTIQTGQPGNVHFTKSVRYYLAVKNMNSISIFSSGNIQAPDLKAERFSISVSSSGNLKMGDLQADALTVNIFSSGDVTMGVLNARLLEVNINSSGDLSIGGGEVERQNIAINSSGNYRAQNVASDESFISLNSSGDAAIRVRNQLTANLNSSGDLRYLGNPTVNVNKGSSGDLIHMGN